MTWGYSDVIEPCGECYGFGDTCAFAKARQWLTHCNTYFTAEGNPFSPSHVADLRGLEARYDAIHGCFSRCAGKLAQRAAIKRLVAELP